MDRTAFMKAISTKLYPILRAEGFSGSGNTLRRINDPIVHVFNLQGSSGGETCYVNFGAHLMFLPKSGGGQPDAKKLKEYECAFRDRLDPPTGQGFGWSYGTDQDEMNETIAFICDHWSIYGHEFFNRYSLYPNDFASLVENSVESTVHPIELITLARIAAHLGKNTRAKALAKEALRRCPERATGLRTDLEQLVHDVT